VLLAATAAIETDFIQLGLHSGGVCPDPLLHFFDGLKLGHIDFPSGCPAKYPNP